MNVRKITAGGLLGLVIGLVLSMPMGASATATPSIDSPGNGQTVTGSSVNVHVTGNGACGISRARLLLEGPGISGSKEVWNSGTDARPRNSSLDESFTLNVVNQSKYNGSFQLNLLVKEWVSGTINCTESSSWTSSNPVGFKMDVNPAAPSWLSGYPSVKIVDGAPEITSKWKANTEPDLVSYQITRSGSGADFVDDLTPGTVCRSGTCTYIDRQFAGTGYSGTYTYTLRAYRNNSSGSDTLASSSSTRSKSVSEPAPPPPPSNTGGGGGSGSGGGSSNGGAGGGSGGSTGGGSNGGGLNSNGGAVDPATQGLTSNGGAAAPTTPGGALPGGGSGADFYSGTYSNRLPYQNRTLLVPGSETLTKNRRQAIGPGYEAPGNVMKMLIPIAGGLLFIMLAAHARRMLRDH